jgi:hypothetical protein
MKYLVDLLRDQREKKLIMEGRWWEALLRNSIYQGVALLELHRLTPETKMQIPLISSKKELSFNLH